MTTPVVSRDLMNSGVPLPPPGPISPLSQILCTSYHPHLDVIAAAAASSLYIFAASG
jgi:hypothetical protein